YDPGSDSWGTFPNFIHATRNYGFAQLDGYLYALGGYDYSNNTPNGANFNQRFDATTPSVTNTPSATYTSTVAVTRTRTRTSTPVPITGTPTQCSISFSDVHPGDYFYEAVQYLACHGIVSGYADGTFRPYNN